MIMDVTTQGRSQNLKEDNEKEKVLSIIKSCIASAKQNLTIEQLARDYKQLVGSPIPFKKFQQGSVASFLQSVPHVVRVVNRGGQLYVNAVSSEETIHLENLIRGQKKSKTRGCFSKPNSMRRPRNTAWVPPNYFHRPYSAPPKPSLLPSPALLPTPTQPPNSFRKPPQPHGDSLHKKPWIPANTGAAVPVAMKAGPPPPSRLQPTVQLPAQPIAQFPPRLPVRAPAQPLVQPPAQTPVQFPATAPKKVSSESSAQVTPTSGKPTKGDKGAPSYQTQLEQEAKRRNISDVVFKTIPCGKKKNYWLSTVKIGEQKFSSFPEEKGSPLEAIEEAAKNALQALRTTEPPAKEFGPETQDFDLATQRIKEILSEKSGGVWWHHVQALYSRRFNETVAPSLIEDMNQRKVEGLNIIEPIAGQWVLSLEKDSNIPDTDKTTNDISSSSPARPQPEPLQLPEDKLWNVFVSYLKDCSEVWFRLIGEQYSDAYENLVTDMELFYMDEANMLALKNPSIGDYYACSHVESWFRVQLVSVEGDLATVFFIDHGDNEVIPLAHLFQLGSNFLQLPAQAIQTCLAGFEYGFSLDPLVLTEAHNLAQGKSLVAEVFSRDEPLSVILFDTSTSDDVNINERLLEMLPQAYPSPSLPPKGGVCEVYLCHVTSSGDVYVRIESASYQILQSLLLTARKRAAEILGDEEVTIDLGKLYLTKFSPNGEWERAAPRSANKDADGRSLLCQLHNVPSSPNLQWTQKTSEQLLSLFSKMDEPMLLKVIREGTGEKPPQVELFQRVQPQNLLVSVNATLAMNSSLFSNEDKNNNLNNDANEEVSLALSQCNNAGSQRTGSPYNEVVVVMALEGLSPPDLPEVNKYFDVFVTYAASPSHFAVQSFKNTVRLEWLMGEMRSCYSDKTKLESVSKIHEGGYYALLHTDTSWYRVRIDQSRGEFVSGVFVDYGDCFCSTTDKIQQLWPNFKQFPYQAFKASLGGIIPLNKDWTPEDSCRFRELVDNRPFVSIVTQAKAGSKQEQPTLVLRLIDTKDPQNDVYIDEVLIKEGRARRPPKPAENNLF